LGQMRNAYKIWSENQKVSDHSEKLCIYGKITLELIFGK